MELSKRLQAVADLVSVGQTACDAGCDHGYVSIYLVEKKIRQKVIAMDVNKGPLNRAKEHIIEKELENYIETRLSDGVTALKAGEADCLILAGMGGRLIIRILTEGMEKIRSMKELILQPQSELPLVRKYLRSQGFTVVKEDMVFEDGKYYPMMKVLTEGCENLQKKTDAETDRQVFDRYGECLLKEKNPVLLQYLLLEEAEKSSIMENLKPFKNERQQERYEELKGEAVLRKAAMAYYGGMQCCAEKS